MCVTLKTFTQRLMDTVVGSQTIMPTCWCYGQSRDEHDVPSCQPIPHSSSELGHPQLMSGLSIASMDIKTYQTMNDTC